MSTLTEFLLARIAEDEQQATMAGGDTWHAVPTPPIPTTTRSGHYE